MAGPTAFQANAFQNNAFQIAASTQSLIVTDTIVKLQKPINFVIAGQQPEEKDTPRFITDFAGILKRIFRE